jgi:hypothetical protein
MALRNHGSALPPLSLPKHRQIPILYNNNIKFESLRGTIYTKVKRIQACMSSQGVEYRYNCLGTKVPIHDAEGIIMCAYIHGGKLHICLQYPRATNL